MIKRPTAQDSEDDLLRMQEEFAKNSSKPAAAVISKKPTSKFASSRAHPVIETASFPIIGGIVEKNLDLTEFEFKLPTTKSTSSTTSAASKQFEILPSTSTTVHQSQEIQDLESIKHQVHVENTNRLSTMSKEEIMKEREELMKKLDPKLIEFIKKKKAEKSSASVQVPKSADGELKEDQPDNPSAIEALPLEEFPIRPTSQWPHMDQPEPEKMAWMGSLPEIKYQELYTARFDFKGHLVPRNVDIPVIAGLHHHGREPEAPGYTIEEMLRLCRSQVVNQRVIALNTLASIVALAKSDAFDQILIPPTLMKTLLEANVCTIMRYALDDTAQSVVVAACHLLASFLHSPLDEACLDIAYGLSLDTSELSFSPIPTDDASNADMEESMDDEALCNRDMILGLLRMEILHRLRYILEVLQPKSGQCVADIFSILIRIARHGKKACKQIFECPRLFDVIVKQFVPSEWRNEGIAKPIYPSFDAPYWGAVKLCKILAASNRDIAVAMVENDKIVDSMIRYIVTEPEEMMIPLPDSCQLIIEAYRLWSQLVIHGLCTAYFSDLFETMVNHVRAAVTLESDGGSRQFHWDRAAALALMVEKFAKIMKSCGESNGQLQLKGIVDVMIMALMKLLQECKTDADISYYYTMAAFTNCCTTAVSCQTLKLDQKQLDTMVGEYVSKFQANFGDRFERDSAAPARSVVRLLWRDPSCLPSLESVGGESLMKMIRDNSSYPLFSALRRLCHAVTCQIS